MATELNARFAGEQVELDDRLLAELHTAPTLRHLCKEDVAFLGDVERLRLAEGTMLVAPGDPVDSFCVLLEGEVAILKLDGKYEVELARQHPGDTFGEVPLLMGRQVSFARAVTVVPSTLLRIGTQAFWRMLAESPLTREAILADYARRFETYQAIALHREKLISLGTLAAGLMHELNNPGAAARRASAQLRENITRLQHLSLKLTRTPLDSTQLGCLGDLQEQVLSQEKIPTLSPLEQSDREEEFIEWLESIQVENPWRLAPTMVSAGWTRADIDCAHHSFPGGALSDALNYLEALISSMQQVGTIEESIARVTDLVTAVKKYAYDDKNKQQMVDVRDSLVSTLTILNHKFRQKGLRVESSLPSAETRISCMGAGLAQVWTNLLDNAIDAAPEQGSISVRLWTGDESVYVGIKDNGCGIPQEHRDHIFEPFYTTKEAGVGTGLGLDIVHRIVVGNFRGEVQFSSEPGATEFVVRLPIEQSSLPEGIGCKIAGS